VIQRVSRPDPEVIYVKNCIELEFNVDIVGEDGYHGWAWRNSVVQADSRLTYITADNKESYLIWKEAFSAFL
jgi:hypothetical protein